MASNQSHNPSDDTPLPLATCQIIITRPRAQSEEMSQWLEAAGATVLHFPMIETVAPDSWDGLDAALARFADFDWLIFTSANSVKFFFQRLAEFRDGEAPPIGQVRLGAIGTATAKALERAGGHVELIAEDSKAEGLLQALLEQVGGAERLRGLRFLIPRARVARDLLPDELRKRGAQVEVVEAYQTIKPEVDQEPLLALLKNRTINVITFTSSSTVHNFITTIGAAEAPELLQGTFLACIGPVTAGTAQTYHLKNIIQPPSYTAKALVQVILEALGKN